MKFMQALVAVAAVSAAAGGFLGGSLLPGKEGPENEACLPCHDKAFIGDSVPGSLSCLDYHPGAALGPGDPPHAPAKDIPGPGCTVRCHNLEKAGGATRGTASDEDCMICHSDQALKSGAGEPLYVDLESYQSSIHGLAELACVDCHADLKETEDFPHAEKLAAVRCALCHEDAAKELTGSVHDGSVGPVSVSCKDCHGSHHILPKDDAESSVYSINLPETCEGCHLSRIQTKRGQDFIERYNESVHFKALTRSGLSLSATCMTCHGGHDVLPTEDPDSRVARRNIIATCGSCHTGIERDYLEGVHGKDYVKGVADVPVCTDCHSEHNIKSPLNLDSEVYATHVAAVCSRCHDDERLARQYGFLTSRLKSFSNSFHGTASQFGETRVANCASCHGFHDIRVSSDPKSSVNPGRLSETCGRCHPGAGANFAKGKIHVVAQKTESRGAYIAKVFYIVAIGGLISVFIVFIIVDLFRRARNRWAH